MSFPNNDEGRPSKSLILTLAKGAGISLVGRMAGRGLLLLGQVVLARSLGPNEYGLFTLGWTVLQISLYASPVGLQQGVIRFGSPAWNRDWVDFRRIIQQSLFLTFASALILGGVLFLLSPIISDIFNKPDLTFILRSTAIVLALSIILKVIAATTRISQRMQFSILIEDVFPSLLIVIGAFIFTVMQKKGVYGGEAALLLSYAISTMLALIFLIRLYPGIFQPVNWQLSLFRNLASFFLPASLASTLIILIQWSTRLLLGYFCPEEEVGVYQAASQLASLSAIVLVSINTIFIPIISELSSEGKIKQLDELYKITTKWSLYISLPLFFVMIIFPSASLSTVFGKSYMVGEWVLIIMAIGQMINAATGAVTSLHVMLGYQKRLITISVISLVITVLLNLLLIPKWGMLGAAVGNSLGISIFNLSGMVSIKQLVRLSPFDQRYRKGLIASFFTLMPLLALSRFYQTGFFPLIIASIMACGFFPFFLWWLGFDNEDQQFLTAIRNRLGV